MKYEEARRILRSLSRKLKAHGEHRYAQALIIGEKCIKELCRMKSRKQGDMSNDK